MSSHSDLWFFHASMGKSDIRGGLGDDRVFFSDLGLTHDAARTAVLDALIRWWGGDWPNEPTRQDRPTVAQINSYRYEETPRSIADGLLHKEFIVYPPNLTIDEAMVQISPSRVQ
ncbi:MAG: hypothetical protein KDD89_08965 [Anaerolineales bacterium]|nr:hypothetical protein [Anaerolineales bacterium]